MLYNKEINFHPKNMHLWWARSIKCNTTKWWRHTILYWKKKTIQTSKASIYKSKMSLKPTQNCIESKMSLKMTIIKYTWATLYRNVICHLWEQLVQFNKLICRELLYNLPSKSHQHLHKHNTTNYFYVKNLQVSTINWLNFWVHWFPAIWILT